MFPDVIGGERTEIYGSLETPIRMTEQIRMLFVLTGFEMTSGESADSFVTRSGGSMEPNMSKQIGTSRASLSYRNCKHHVFVDPRAVIRPAFRFRIGRR